MSISISRPVVIRRKDRGLWIGLFGMHEFLVWLPLLFPYKYAPLSYLRNTTAYYRQAHGLFQWDSLWYINIGKYGYAHLPKVSGDPHLAATAFFPFVPVLIHLFSPWGALVATQGAFAASLFFFERIIKRFDPSPAVVFGGLTLLAFNPAAIYYATLYAEPWTLFFTLASVELAHRGRYGVASILGGLAATTQATGILVGIFPLIACVIALLNGDRKGLLRNLAWGVGAALGLVSYGSFLGVRFHDPLLFVTMQGIAIWKGTWTVPGVQWIDGLPFSFHHGIVPLRLALWLCTTAFILGTVGVVKLRVATVEQLAFKVYGVIGILVSLSFMYAGWPLHSTVRIASVYFPMYLGLTQWSPWIMRLTILGFAVTAFYGGVLFTHHWWFQ